MGVGIFGGYCNMLVLVVYVVDCFVVIQVVFVGEFVLGGVYLGEVGVVVLVVVVDQLQQFGVVGFWFGFENFCGGLLLIFVVGQICLGVCVYVVVFGGFVEVGD